MPLTYPRNVLQSSKGVFQFFSFSPFKNGDEISVFKFSDFKKQTYFKTEYTNFEYLTISINVPLVKIEYYVGTIQNDLN